MKFVDAQPLAPAKVLQDADRATAMFPISPALARCGSIQQVLYHRYDWMINNFQNVDCVRPEKNS